jgi:sulfatase maturation enzyme AslB (radical SAM superfamily)
MDYQTIMKLHEIEININLNVEEHNYNFFFAFLTFFCIYLKVYCLSCQNNSLSTDPHSSLKDLFMCQAFGKYLSIYVRSLRTNSLIILIYNFIKLRISLNHQITHVCSTH